MALYHLSINHEVDITFSTFLCPSLDVYITDMCYSPIRFVRCNYNEYSNITIGIFASIALTIVGKQGLSQWAVARIFYFLTSNVLGIKIVVKNSEYLKLRPAMLIANHQSELDVLILGAIFPQYCSVTAKKALKYYPFLGWFMILSRSVFIDRIDREDAIRSFAGTVQQVKKNKQSIFVFPEGTRSHFTEPNLLPFKKGAFHYAVQAQVAVVPIIVGNYSKLFSFKNKIFKSGTIEIEVLQPVTTVGLTAAGVSGLVQETQKRMAQAVARIGYSK